MKKKNRQKKYNLKGIISKKEQWKSRGYDKQLDHPISREEATNEIRSYKTMKTTMSDMLALNWQKTAFCEYLKKLVNKFNMN